MLYTSELNPVAFNKSKELERQQRFQINRLNTHQSPYWRSGLLRFPSATRPGAFEKRDIDQENANALQQEEVSMWQRYAINTSIHGVKYTSAEELHWVERMIWIIVVLLAVFGVGYTSLLFAGRFNSAPMATVIESIIYPVSDISFPSVNVCLNNRLSWKRVLDIKNIIRKDRTNETVALFMEFMRVLDGFKYGEFNKFAALADKKLNVLDDVNTTYIYKNAMHPCEEMFQDQCWWRNRYYDCCKLFVEQKSEFGICYAFNSAVNDVGFVLVGKDSSYPWRTSSGGQFSGLRFTINTSLASFRTDRDNRLGILVSIQDPFEWANSPVFIPTGHFASVVIKPSVSNVTPAIHRIPPALRQCVYEKDPPENRSTLAGLKYLLPNCLSKCKLDFIGRYCNCTIGFFFPTRFKSNYSACALDGFQCLIQYNKILNYYKPQIESVFFDNNEEGLMCNCLPECDRIQYTSDVSTVRFAEEKQDLVEVDVHFAFSSMVRYRTDVTFDFLDLMVAFGGLAGLFLGCSILSGGEVIFYLVIGLYHSGLRVVRPYITKLRKQTWTKQPISTNYEVKRINVSNKIEIISTEKFN